MKPTVRLKVTTERNFSAHHMLIGAARASLEDAKAKRPGFFYSQLIAMTLSALSIEAMCNAIGDRVISDWKDFETSSPNAKLRLLCERLKVQYDKSLEPWASARRLFKFRNLIAHAKPELVREEKVFSREEYDNRSPEFPKSKLEKGVTLENASRAVHTAEQIKDILCTRVPPEDALGLYSDSSFGHASLHHDG